MINKNIILILLAKLASIFGTRVFNFALSFYLLTKTGSGLSFGISLALTAIPHVIISPFAGVIVDRFSKKKILVYSDLLSAAVMLILVFASINTFNIYLSVLLLSIIGALFDIAVDVAIPELSSEKIIKKVNSISSSITYLAAILSPVIGGYLVAVFDLRLFAIVNCLSFLISALSECFINFTKTTEISGKIKTVAFFSDMRDATIYIKQTPTLLLFILADILLNFSFSVGYTVTLPFIILNELKMTSTHLGNINSAMSIGSVLASVIMISRSGKNYAKDSFKYPTMPTILLALCLVAFGVIGINESGFINRNLLVAILSINNFFIGIFTVIINIQIVTTIQMVASKEYLGKVFGLLNSSSYLSVPISVLLAGYLIDLLPSEILFITSGLMIVIIAIYIIIKTNCISQRENVAINLAE